ncbi:hypothetical protein [Virgisporangium aurantiacum]|uniref:Uncharacterized protein n=1 Tax=Virgisporangium aurantiacum TaxID=175570 RepID=A0A8J3ZL24_9ACTN|nr:hypothetical protein [Virgisporangium aurantiacum]GIJ63456.1 hypothetical protein Vau01_109720 [Virgisporangium aurantiacum]
MAVELIAITTAAVAAGVAEATRRLLSRRQPDEPAPGTVTFGEVHAGGAVTQSGRDVTIRQGRPE